MDLLLIAGVMVVFGTLLGGDLYLQRAYVVRLRAQWQRANRAIRLGPVGVICHGDRPPGEQPRRVFGALGLVDDRIVFSGQRDSAFDLDAPLESIRWIGTRTRARQAWNRRIEAHELVIHLETPDGWRVYLFTESQPEKLAEQIAAAAGLDLHRMGSLFEDYGPVLASALTLDAGGRWQRVAAQDWEGVLYLAPDRLLFDWHDPILLDHIRQARALTVREFDTAVLRIDCEIDGARRVAGFLVEDADAWAEVLEGDR